jgi:hypothetical protein
MRGVYVLGQGYPSHQTEPAVRLTRFLSQVPWAARDRWQMGGGTLVNGRSEASWIDGDP